MEYIQNCLEDASSSIDCAEKYFNMLISALFFRHKSIDKADLTKNETLLELFAKLNSFLNLEGGSNSKLDESINNSKDYFMRGDHQSSFQEINRGFRTYRPLNIFELKRLRKEVGNAGDLIKNKDIILLLGETGAGKTTIIQFLLGMKMEEKTNKGILHIEGDTDEYLLRKYPKGVFDENIIKNIKNLKSSCFMQSETRYLNPIQIDLGDSYNRDSIIICDTPGFRDSNGTEVDIANGISIIKTISMAKSVKPLILISEKGFGDRGQELKRYAMTIASILPDFYDFYDEINIIYTKFKKDEIQNILSKINNLIDLPSNKDSSNDALKNFFALLKKKIERNKRDANKYILDPLNDNPATLLDLIVERTNEIEDPGKNFKYFITEESLNDINVQFSIHTNVIHNCLSKNEFEIVKFKLEELKFLHEETENINLNNKYQDLVKKVLNHIDDVSENCKSELSVLFKLEDEINKDHLEKIRQTYKFIEKLDVFKGKIDDNTLPDKNFFDQCIKKQLKEFENFVENFKVNDFRVSSKIKKIKILSAEFSCFKPMLDIAKFFISKQLKEFEESIDIIFLDGENSNFDYKMFKVIIEDLNELIKNYKEIIENEKTCLIEKKVNMLIQFYHKKYNQCLEFLNYNVIENSSQKVSNSFSIFQETLNEEINFDKSNNEKEGIKRINEFFEKIRIVLEHPINIGYETFDLQQTFKNLETKMKNSIINIFNENYIKIHEKINQKEITDLSEEEDQEKFKKMKILSDIKKTSNELKIKFNDLTKSLQKFFTKISKEITKSVNSPEENIQLRIRKLKDLINNIDKMKWIEQYNKIAFEEFQERIEEIILNNQEKDIDILERSTLTLSNHSDLIEKANSYWRLCSIFDLFSKSKNISSKIRISIDSFTKSLQDIIDDLKYFIADLELNNQGQSNFNEFQLISNDLVIFDNPILQKLKNIVLFLNTLKNVNSKIKNNNYIKEIETLYNKLESILSNSKINNKNEIEQMFLNLRSIIRKDLSSEDESYYTSDYNYTIQNLKRILEFYKKIKVNYNEILYLFDPHHEFKDCLISSLKEFSSSFETEIEIADENENLMKLKILHNFSKTFDLINLDYIDNLWLNFTKHKEKIYNIIKNFIPKNEIDFDESLKRCDFSELNNLFSRYYGNDKRNFQNLQRKLHKYFEDKLEDVHNMADEFLNENYKVETAKKIAKSYEEINKLLKIDEKYLLKKDENVEKIKQITDSLIDKFISEIDSISEAGYSIYNNPIDLDSKISYLNKIKKDLNNLLFDGIEDRKIYDTKLNENISKIEEMIKIEINDFKKKKTLKEIADGPSYNFYNLKLKLKNIKLSSLQPLKADLQNYLIEKFEEEFKKMEECYKADEFKKMKKNVDKCLNYLEEDHILHHFKEKFENLQNDFIDRKIEDYDGMDKMQKNNYNLFQDHFKEKLENLQNDIIERKIENIDGIEKLQIYNDNLFQVNKINDSIKIEDYEKFVYRTIILLEASPNMSAFLKNFPQILDQVKLNLMKKINDYNLNIFLKFQIVLYHDYNMPSETILEISDWECNSDDLEKLLKNANLKEDIYESYATELGLFHVNKECKTFDISQVILIGKYGSNSEEVVIYKKDLLLGIGWENTIYAENLDYINESIELKRRNITVNSIYLSCLAKSSFELISKITDGVCKQFEDNFINNEKLKDLIIDFFLKDFEKYR